MGGRSKRSGGVQGNRTGSGFGVWDGDWLLALQPVSPVVWITFDRRDGDDPDSVRLVEVDDGIGKVVRQVPPGVGVDPAEEARCRTDLCNRALDLVLKPPAEFRADSRVVRGGSGVFLVGLGMEAVRLHRPTIWRTRAETTSPGTP